MKYLYTPKFELMSVESTLAKKQFSKFFTDEMTETHRYFYEEDEESNDYTVYEADSTYKRKIVHPEISVAKYACSEHNKKLFFGKPSHLLMLEEIAYRLSVDELRNIFKEVV